MSHKACVGVCEKRCEDPVENTTVEKIPLHDLWNQHFIRNPEKATEENQEGVCEGEPLCENKTYEQCKSADTWFTVFF